MTRPILTLTLLFIATCLIWTPLYLIITGLNDVSSHEKAILLQLGARQTGNKAFVGSDNCGISFSDLYHISVQKETARFCKDRTSLLTAMGEGSRKAAGGPFIGKTCQYRWFPTPEICMILERFSSISFIGDDAVRSIYIALNILLSEDLSLGGLQGWMMGDEERRTCKCDGQFWREGCLKKIVRSSEKAKRNLEKSRLSIAHYCSRVKHSYIESITSPASQTAINTYKDLTYNKPHPWQPSPMIISFAHPSNYDTVTTSQALDEWVALALGAERNIPMLYIGAPALGVNGSLTGLGKERNMRVQMFEMEMESIAREKHLDVLGLFNSTLKAENIEGGGFGLTVWLAEAMIVINWLSKLPTS